MKCIKYNSCNHAGDDCIGDGFSFLLGYRGCRDYQIEQAKNLDDGGLVSRIAGKFVDALGRFAGID